MSSRLCALAMAMVWVLSPMCACATRRAVSGCDNPFPQLTNRFPALPSTVPSANGGAVVIGTVADSASQHALSGSVIRIYPNVEGRRDTTRVFTDSAGGFALRLPGRGRYMYAVLTVNYSQARGSIDVAREMETLRVVQRGALPLCNVRLTDAMTSPPRT